MSEVEDLPNGWGKAELGCIAGFEMGQAPPGEECNKEGHGAVFVKAGEFGDLYPFVREWTTRPLKYGRKDDVFICVVGATCGKLNLGIDCAIGRSVAAIQPVAGIESRFLYYQLLQFVGELRASSTGSAQGVLTRKHLSNIQLRLAPLPEQRRIVAKIEELFSDLDAGVAALERAKANLKRYRAAVLKSAVEGKLTDEWRARHPNTEPASQLLERILAERRRKWEADQLAKFAAAGKDPPKNWREKYVEPSHEEGLYPLPATWTWASTQEICERVENGNTPSPELMSRGEGEVPFIKVYNLTKSGQLDFSVNPTFVSRHTHESVLRRSRVIPNDVLMNIVGPPLGKVSLVTDDYREWNTNQAVVIFRASQKLLPRYLTVCLMSDEVLFWVIRTARATAGQSNISVGNCRLLPIPLPPIEEQAAIVETVDERLSQIDAAEAIISHSLTRAARLRQSILKQAFEGKLVPQDPNDEPASQLLGRLRGNECSSPAPDLLKSPTGSVIAKKEARRA